MGKHKALKGAIAAVASVATLGALQPSATATPRRSQARRWQVCGRIHRIQRRCSAFLRAQGQVRQRGLRFRQLHSQCGPDFYLRFSIAFDDDRTLKSCPEIALKIAPGKKLSEESSTFL